MFSLPMEPVLAFLLVFVRVTLFLTLLPVYGEAFTPVSVRALLGMAVALVLTPVVHVSVAVFPQSVLDFVLLMLPEAFVGFLLGMVGRLLFGAVQFAGMLIGNDLGFNMANVVNPDQSQIPVMGEFLYVCALLLFFAVHGDHAFFLALERSFHVAPPGAVHMPLGVAAFFNGQATAMFVVGVQLSLPIMAVAFVVNVGMGMLVKALPQLNVFMESFPVRIIVGLFLLGTVANLIARLIVDRMQALGPDLEALVGLLGR